MEHTVAASHKKQLLTTGDMARRTGNTLRTVRFYEEEGLLTPTARSQGGHRLFDENQLHKLQLISDLRNIGLALPVIKEVFRIKQECHSASEASAQVKEFLGAQIAKMQERIRLLQRVSDDFQAAMEVFHECKSCKEDWIHRRCSSCEVMARATLPSTVRMIWLSDPALDKDDPPPRSPGPILG
jgi:DNA-binding transcriptional MerR regulator